MDNNSLIRYTYLQCCVKTVKKLVLYNAELKLKVQLSHNGANHCNNYKNIYCTAIFTKVK
jgi:hypothetical protein